MANSLNRVMLIGHLGRDPEIRYTPDGKEVANFTLATSEFWKDKATGEKKEKTEWHRVVVFNDVIVAVVKQYVKKGNKIYVEGVLQTRKWIDQATGHDRYITEIILGLFNSQLMLLDAKNTGDAANEPTKAAISSASTSHDQSGIDDEIPF